MGGREGRQGRAYGLRTMGEFGHKVELSYEYGLPASIRASPLPAFSAREDRRGCRSIPTCVEVLEACQ